MLKVKNKDGNVKIVLLDYLKNEYVETVGPSLVTSLELLTRRRNVARLLNSFLLLWKRFI